MLPDFIPTGHVVKASFNESPGLHNAFWFTYRPYAGIERDEALTAASGGVGALYGVIRARLMKWSFDRDITDESLKTLSSPIFDKLSGVVLSTRGADSTESEAA
jgi:hypothetical protein